MAGHIIYTPRALFIKYGYVKWVNSGVYLVSGSRCRELRNTIKLNTTSPNIICGLRWFLETAGLAGMPGSSMLLTLGARGLPIKREGSGGGTFSGGGKGRDGKPSVSWLQAKIW